MSTGVEPIAGAHDAVVTPAARPSTATTGKRPASRRRFVAVAVTALELLRPGSDLARIASGAEEIDLLLVAEDEPVDTPAPVRVLAAVPDLDGDPNGDPDGSSDDVADTIGSHPDLVDLSVLDGDVLSGGRPGGEFADEDTTDADDMDADEPDEDDSDEARAALDAGLRSAAGLTGSELRLHRLGLRLPLRAPAEDDVLAALSELVGFDPEPGVYCLAPAVSSDPERSVVEQAVQRIVRVYGLPLLRYRCHELVVVAGPQA